jgi:hypothetical protein
MAGRLAHSAIPMQAMKAQPMMIRPNVFTLMEHLPHHSTDYRKNLTKLLSADKLLGSVGIDR